MCVCVFPCVREKWANIYTTYTPYTLYFYVGRGENPDSFLVENEYRRTQAPEEMSEPFITDLEVLWGPWRRDLCGSRDTTPRGGAVNILWSRSLMNNYMCVWTQMHTSPKASAHECGLLKPSYMNKHHKHNTKRYLIVYSLTICQYML